MHIINMNLSLSFLLLCILSLLSPLSSATSHRFIFPKHPPPHKISAVFAFGDSTLDPGNNNYIHTFVRANHAPYGRDFPGHVPTGRFSNGKLITDFLVSSLGLKELLPPYAQENLTTADLLTGVSFASAGSGLHNMTAFMSSTIPIKVQVDNFEAYLKNLTSLVGAEKANKTVKHGLFVIGAGSNDMMMNYYPFGRAVFTLDGYHDFLLDRMTTDVVQRLYDKGARRFTIAGLPPLGCIPLEMTFNPDVRRGPNPKDWLNKERTCVTQHNLDAVSYNAKLERTMKLMPYAFRGSRFAYVDIYNPLWDMMTNPKKYGFDHTKLGCCGIGGIEMGLVCGKIFKKTCDDPSKYMFWDSVHPSEATYKALADKMMKTVLSEIMRSDGLLV